MPEGITKKVFTDEPHVFGIVKSAKVKEQLLAVFHEIPEISCIVTVGTLESARQEIAESSPNSLVLLEVDDREKDIVESLRVWKETPAGRQHPLVVLSSGLDQGKITLLLRAGVRDFLPWPLSVEEARKSVLRLATRSRRGTDRGTDNHKIITFAHASGGMGATTLAVNAATIINAASNHNSDTACLLDLDLQFGGASIHLDLPGYSPVMDLIDKPERLDREMLEGMMMRHGSGLRILTTPEAPLPVEAIGSETIERLLQTARKRYKYTVVDMPQTMTLWTGAVFRRSKVIYVVFQLNVPSIRQLRRWLSVLDQEGLSDLPIKVVANRHLSLGRIGHGNISIAQASEAIGRRVDYMIPNDYALISQSLDQGMPAAGIRPNSKFVQQLKVMLQDAVDEIEIPKRSFLGRQY